MNVTLISYKVSKSEPNLEVIGKVDGKVKKLHFHVAQPLLENDKELAAFALRALEGYTAPEKAEAKPAVKAPAKPRVKKPIA